MRFSWASGLDSLEAWIGHTVTVQLGGRRLRLIGGGGGVGGGGVKSIGGVRSMGGGGTQRFSGGGGGGGGVGNVGKRFGGMRSTGGGGGSGGGGGGGSGVGGGGGGPSPSSSPSPSPPSGSWSPSSTEPRSGDISCRTTDGAILPADSTAPLSAGSPVRTRLLSASEISNPASTAAGSLRNSSQKG
jgi:hypothetical protein